MGHRNVIIGITDGRRDENNKLVSVVKNVIFSGDFAGKKNFTNGRKLPLSEYIIFHC